MFYFYDVAALWRNKL